MIPPGEKPYQVAACMDLIRSLKKQNFWMMEMESGPTGGAIIGANPRPGQTGCGQCRVLLMERTRLFISGGVPVCLEQNSSGMEYCRIMVYREEGMK